MSSILHPALMSTDCWPPGTVAVSR